MNTYYVTLLLDKVAHYQSKVKAKNIFNAMKQADRQWRKENWCRGLDDGLDICFGENGYHIDVAYTQNFLWFEEAPGEDEGND